MSNQIQACVRMGKISPIQGTRKNQNMNSSKDPWKKGGKGIVEAIELKKGQKRVSGKEHKRGNTKAVSDNCNGGKNGLGGGAARKKRLNQAKGRGTRMKGGGEKWSVHRQISRKTEVFQRRERGLRKKRVPSKEALNRGGVLNGGLTLPQTVKAEKNTGNKRTADRHRGGERSLGTREGGCRHSVNFQRTKQALQGTYPKIRSRPQPILKALIEKIMRRPVFQVLHGYNGWH